MNEGLNLNPHDRTSFIRRFLMVRAWFEPAPFRQAVLQSVNWVNRLSVNYKTPFIWRKVVAGNRVTFPVEPTLVSVCMTKRVTPSLELTELTHALFVLSKCLYGPAGLPSNRGDPARRLTLKEGPQKRFFNPVIPTQNFGHSCNPKVYVWHLTSRAYSQSRISPRICSI